MAKEEFFPLKELIDFKGNRYELAHACMKRVYSLLIENRAKNEFREEDEDGIFLNLPEEHARAYGSQKVKITSLSMHDVLKNKIKYYNDKGDENL